MSSSIYSRLAVTNIKNNRKTYVPYILTAILTVMMYYIMDALSKNPEIGDGSLKSVLDCAVWVIIIFAIIFLFYTNSFLIKRRKKEIGVYNILAMGKPHIARMLTIETMITAVLSIGAGMICGIIFSKLMYLIFLKILHYDIGMKFNLSVDSLRNTLILFVGIFLLTLGYNLLQIKLSNPIELLHGSEQGEKEPKTKLLLTIFGLISLGIGYYIAIITKEPLTALTNFFAAVVCVILGTYALFVAGSIALLKMLRKNKKFYYQTRHFTAVSGMIYRMKQNAVGLANICILSTMVLVMISTTVSLYAGMDDILHIRFPKECKVSIETANPENEQMADRIIEEETKKAGVRLENILQYHNEELMASRSDDEFQLREFGNYAVANTCEINLIPLEDFNQMENQKRSLMADEVLVYNVKGMYGKDTIKIGDKEYHVAEELEHMKAEPKNQSGIYETYYVIFPDIDQIQDVLNHVYQDSTMDADWIVKKSSISYDISFDLKGKKQNCKDAMNVIKSRIENEIPNASCESRELSRKSFYGLYGGLFFIGVYLGIMFLMATVLIIYYKQISEGYDDRKRYQIMQNVGMSKAEVKRSIRSQVLIVFFLPLVMAVIHITVAFGVITKLLAVLNLVNVELFRHCTVATVAVFAAFYAGVFTITTREYYKIVK